MSLQDLPYDILHEILRQGGLDLLSSESIFCCRSLYQVSLSKDLWLDAITPVVHECGYAPSQVAFILDPRKWYIEQLEFDKKVSQSLNRLAEIVSRPDSSSVVERIALHIVRPKLRALPQLSKTVLCAPSLSHRFWATWFKTAVIKLSGLHKLLDLSSKNNMGHDLVDIPVEAVMALYCLRYGVIPTDTLALLESELQAKDFSTSADLMMHVNEKVDAPLRKRSDFFSSLLKSCVFTSLAYNVLGWETQLVCFPMLTFCAVKKPEAEEPEFVDFSRVKIRSVQEIRDRLAMTQTSPSEAREGISLHDILATTYVWHSVPTPESRSSIIDLVKHAALESSLKAPHQIPKLWRILTDHVINKNVEQELGQVVTCTPLLTPQHTGEPHIAVGQVCRLVGVPPGMPYCVVLEAHVNSYYVLRGIERLRVGQGMLVPGYSGELVTNAGLILPDIDADIDTLGQYFFQYDQEHQRFFGV